MKDFYDKKEYTIDDIKSLIDNEVEESIYLDFKDAKALDKNDLKKKEISKDVSAFANSDGGIIVYGISEKNHKADHITFIDGNIYTKEWLEQIINSSIQRRISEILIYPIRNLGKIEETIYIVKIPKSLDAPHLNKDKKFYKRFNFESVPMEEYEIRQSYGRKLKTKLIINGWSLKYVNNDNDEYLFNCEIQVANDGDIIESQYKVNVYFENFNYITLSWPQNISNYSHTHLENRTKISAHISVPIYQNETIDAFRFDIKVKKEHIEYAFNDVPVEIRLFYSDGEDVMETTMEEMTKNFKIHYLEFIKKENSNEYQEYENI